MKRGLIILFVFLFFISEVNAISISPSSFDFEFDPGKIHNITFTVGNKDKNDELPIYVVISGELNESTIIEEDSVVLRPLEHKNFNFLLTLPEELLPGAHHLFLTAVEGYKDSNEFEGVAAVAGVRSVVTVRVPYPGKYIDVSFNAKNAKVGTSVDFRIDVISRGVEDIKELYSIIEIYDINGNKVGEIQTNKRQLLSKQTEIFEEKWKIPSEVYIGDYKAVLKTYYDGEIKESQTSFRIGDILIQLLNVTNDEVKKGGIEKVGVVAKSFWNEDINDAYVDLILEENGAEIQRVRSENVNFKSWESKNIEVFLDTNNLELKDYNAKFKITYLDKEDELSFILKVVKRSIFENKLMVGLGAAIILLIIVLLILMIKLNKKKNENKNN